MKIRRATRPCQKVPQLDFQSEFTMSKIIQIFLKNFSMKNKSLGAHFLVTSILEPIYY